MKLARLQLAFILPDDFDFQNATVQDVLKAIMDYRQQNTIPIRRESVEPEAVDAFNAAADHLYFQAAKSFIDSDRRLVGIFDFQEYDTATAQWHTLDLVAKDMS